MRSPDRDWVEDAACRSHPELKTSDFFPGPGGKPFGPKTELIKATCEGCPVRDLCDTYAERTQSTGIWAGKLRQVSYRTPSADGVVTNKSGPVDFA